MEDLWWLQRSIEFNVYYYHCITERCYYLFGVEKKYYIFKPPLFSSSQNHPFLVSFSQVARFLSSRLLSPPTPFVLARGEHRLSITIYSDSRSTSGSNLTGLCTLKNAYLRAPPCLAALNCKATRVSPPHCWGLTRITGPLLLSCERGYRGFFEFCILIRMYILDIFIQSWIIIIEWLEDFLFSRFSRLVKFLFATISWRKFEKY